VGKVEYGKDVLRFIAVIYSIFIGLLFIVFVISFSGIAPEIGEAVLDSYVYTSESFYHLITLIVMILTVFEIYLLFRAAKNPKHSNLLLGLTSMSLITSLITTFTQGFAAFELSNVVWSLVILVGLLFARSYTK